jgi:hypothetical protein
LLSINGIVLKYTAFDFYFKPHPDEQPSSAAAAAVIYNSTTYSSNHHTITSYLTPQTKCPPKRN